MRREAKVRAEPQEAALRDEETIADAVVVALGAGHFIRQQRWRFKDSCGYKDSSFSNIDKHCQLMSVKYRYLLYRFIAT